MIPIIVVASFAVTLVSAAAAGFNGLTTGQLQNIRARLLEGSQASWEIGTAAQALLEYESPELSVFGKTIPPPKKLEGTSETLRYAGRVVDARKTATLVEDNAAADPASIGIAVLLANFTESDHTTKYAKAAASQLSWLLHTVPRGEGGAISHRNEQFQTWADFVSMVPPFLAYYGAMTDNQDLLKQAYDQVSLYRNALRVDHGDFKDTVRHVMFGNWTDPGIWATGQGWFAYGAIRVYQTLNLSSNSSAFTKEKADLIAWAQEIVTATWKHQNPDGSLNNYLDRGEQFHDMSSTALVAAATFRLAAITGRDTNIPEALKAFNLVKEKIDNDGWLTDVVNPHDFDHPGKKSPEGQAFTLQLQAAWKDWVASSQSNTQPKGSNVSASSKPRLGAVAAGWCLIYGMMVTRVYRRWCK